MSCHRPMAEYLCPAHACLFDFDAINLRLANPGSAVTHSTLLDPPSVVSITTAPFTIPQSKLIRLGVNKVKTFSTVASYASLCLLNLRASTRLSLREKKNSKNRNLTHKLLLTSILFLIFSITGVIRGQRVT